MCPYVVARLLFRAARDAGTPVKAVSAIPELEAPIRIGIVSPYE